MTTTNTAEFKITHSHGQTETGIDTYEEALAKVREVYGDVEIGHSGDIQDGGQKTYVWQDAEVAENDDGSHAVCSIRKVYRDEA